MTDDPFDLQRFVRAQDDVYAGVMDELRAGRKSGRWIWFIFPQLLGLGRSPTSRFYAIALLDEARAYLAHPVLGPRLLACVDAVLALPAGIGAVDIFGELDARKVQSSMTLFGRAGPDEPRFATMLERFYDGEPDAATMDIEPSSGAVNRIGSCAMSIGPRTPSNRRSSPPGASYRRSAIRSGSTAGSTASSSQAPPWCELTNSA